MNMHKPKWAQKPKVESKDNVNSPKHDDLLKEISRTYESKNTKYGNSFGDTFDKVGIISAYTRISDKFNRFEYMVMNKDNGTDDERMRDTLLDMANYCLMTVMELEKDNE